MKTILNWKTILIAASLLLAGSLTAVAAIPNPYRGFAATWFDMTRIGPHVFIDDASNKVQALELVERSKARVEAFYGNFTAEPRIILCTTPACHQMFGGGARGTSYGSQLLRVGPRGFNETILTHELFYAELHHRLGLVGMIKNSIPVWFNEGIATYYSRDERLSFDHGPEAKRWIRGAKSHFGDLGNYATSQKWKLAYGAAAANIKDLEASIGQKGLKALIFDVTENGRDFEEALAEIEGKGATQ